MRIRFCAALVASLIVSGAAAPRAQKAPAPAAKKNPLLKLTEPWPTDEVLQAARVVADARRLFRETEPLAFTLTADFTAVNRERTPENKKLFPAVLTVDDAKGAQEIYSLILQEDAKA